MPKRQDLHVYQGTSWSFVYTHRDAAGDPVDLTGYSARMQVRADYGLSSEVYLSSIVGEARGGSITLGGEAGTVTLSMTPDESKDVASSLINYVFTYPVPSPVGPREVFLYDLELVDGAGAVTRPIEGRFIVHREVTS